MFDGWLPLEKYFSPARQTFDYFCIVFIYIIFNIMFSLMG